jgi:hypothetical protein
MLILFDVFRFSYFHRLNACRHFLIELVRTVRDIFLSLTSLRSCRPILLMFDESIEINGLSEMFTLSGLIRLLFIRQEQKLSFLLSLSFDKTTTPTMRMRKKTQRRGKDLHTHCTRVQRQQQPFLFRFCFFSSSPSPCSPTAARLRCCHCD